MTANKIQRFLNLFIFTDALHVIATGKTKVFGFVGTVHLGVKIIINDEALDQVSQFTYLGCSISYQFSNDVELKLGKIFTINWYY